MDDSTVRRERTAGSPGRCLVATRRFPRKTVVVVDLSGVPEADIRVGIGTESGDLVVRVATKTVARVSLPWRCVTATRATITNSILDVHLQSCEASRPSDAPAVDAAG